MEFDVPGPDGFLFSSTDPLRVEHLRVSEYLLSEERRPSNAPFDMAPWRKLPRHNLADHIEAVLRRLAWLHEHDAELDTAHLARLRLSALLRALYTIKASLTEPQLRTLLDLTAPLLGAIEPFGPVERTVDYFEEHDLTPALANSLRNFQARFHHGNTTGKAALQSLSQQLAMLLWFDEWDPLDPARCWSDCVRRDVRAMAGEPRVRWHALLKHIHGNAPVRMPAGWARSARPLLDGVGLDTFRKQIQLWFAPFRSGEPLPLSLAGSHVAKGLVWFCAVAEDEGLKQTCLWLMDARWKQKRMGEKVMTALNPFGISNDELLARQLIAPHPPPLSLKEMLVRQLKKLGKTGVPLVVLPGRIEVPSTGDAIVVHGQQGSYRVFRTTGRIERVSDGAVLELDWSALPDELRVGLQREIDSPEQVSRRVEMLRYDAVYGRYFVVK